MHPTILFVDTFLNELNSNNIKMPHLRYKPLTADFAFEGDYDFITSDKSINQILRILFVLATKFNVNFSINRVKYGKTMISIYSSIDSNVIVLEIWTFLDVRYDDYLPYILWEDIEPFIISENNKYRLSLEFEALYYLSHLKSKKKNLELPLIQKRLLYYKNALEDKYPGYSELYKSLLVNVKLRDEVATKANAILIKLNILFQKSNNHKSNIIKRIRIKASLHRIYAQIIKKNRIYPVVGPDGVGKTSIINELKHNVKSKIKYYRFKSLFRHSLLYKITRPILKRKIDKKLAKNKYDDIYGSWMIYIGFLRFPLLLISALVSRKFYFSDRFFHDFIFQDMRFLEKKAKLRDNWKQLLKKAPNSFWFIHLDAPTDTILSRKNELNYEAVEIYRNDIFTMYIEKPSFIYSYINTSLPIENCVRDLVHVSRKVGIKEKKIIKLDDSLLIGKGNERLCYIHSQDETKVIKVTYKTGKIRNQNELEYVYSQYLESKGVDFKHLSKCYGWIELEESKGLVFERILDFDKTSSITLKKAIENKRISEEYARKLLEELRAYLEINSILFIDVALDNILCKKEKGGYKLVIVDGLGARRPGIKFWLYLHVKSYAKYKVKSQWKKVMENFNKLVKLKS